MKKATSGWPMAHSLQGDKTMGRLSFDFIDQSDFLSGGLHQFNNSLQLQFQTLPDLLGEQVAAPALLNVGFIFEAPTELLVAEDPSNFATKNKTLLNHAIFNFELSGLNGTNGFTIDGLFSGDQSGFSVSGVGDVNNDGVDDFILGARFADTGSGDEGQSYVIFGDSAGFPANFDLSTLDGTNGFEINGSVLDISGLSGFSVAGAGDINGDGIDDILVGAPGIDDVSLTDVGATYVIFGSSTGFSASVDLGALTGTNGFSITGTEDLGESGFEVASAGDVNNDGIDDIIIGAIGPNEFEGIVYVVYGQSAPFVADFNLSDINGTNGFSARGFNAFDFNGSSASSAGDINGDGIDDIMFGAPGALSPTASANTGQVYVIYGSISPIPQNFDLASLDGTNGFVINGVAADDATGASVDTLGDVNGDGIDDIIVGAPGATNSGALDSGGAYVIFGNSSGFPANFELSSLDGTNGFVLEGVNLDDGAGRAVSGAGDVNGDGFADILIGADGGDNNGVNAGEAYLVFGSGTGFAASIDLNSLDGQNGFIINGIVGGDEAGTSVAAAGDVNNDGFDDIIIGSAFATPGSIANAGQSYIIYGSATFGNADPIAQNDALSTDEDTPISGSVFVDNGNGIDSDPDGDAFVVTDVNSSVSSVGFPVAGSAGGLFTINADGTYSFDPNGEFETLSPGATAVSSVTYDIEDTIGGRSTATVSVTVNGVNDLPIANNDIFTTSENVAITGNVFADNGNGVDSDVDSGFTVGQVNGVNTNVGNPIAGSNGGSFVISDTGVLSFDPGTDFDGLAVGESAQTIVTYTLLDEEGGFSGATTVTVTVNGQNDAPIVTGPLAASFNENDPAGSIFLLDNSSDPDLSDTLSIINFTLVGGDDAGISSGSLNELIIDPGAYDSLAVGQTEVITYSYDIIDGNGGSVGQTATISIVGVNDLPVANDDIFSASENLAISGNVFADNGNGVDSDVDSAFTVGQVNGVNTNVGIPIAGSNGGSFIISDAGGLNFNPGTDFDGLAVGESLQTTVSYTLLDEEGGISGATTVTVTVNGVNDAPIVTGPLAASFDENDPAGSLFLLDNASDPDLNDTLSIINFTLVSGDDAGISSGSLNELIIDPSAYSSLATGETEVITYSYDVIDGNGGAVRQTATITIVGTNGLPLAQNDVISGDPNNNSFDLFADNGAGIDSDPDGDAIFIETINGVAVTIGDSVVLSSGLAIQYNGNGNVSLSASNPGLYTQGFSYSIADGNGNTATATVSVNFSLDALDIGQLDGTNGFTISGIDAGDSSGRSVASAGDFNGDGFDDFIIGARFADANGAVDAGESYLIFGTDTGFSTQLDLASLNGTNGFVINGIAASDESGRSVSSAGDLNNDGFDDIAIGAIGADPNGNFAAGATYIVFGAASGFSSSFNLSALNGSNGFVINGVDAGDQSGTSVASAGDVNGDGIDDLLIGAILADPNGISSAGETYVVFGSNSGFASNFNLSGLNGSNGFVINGIGSFDFSGVTVAGGGDFNGDGIADILIGANAADPNGSVDAGQGYVIFGSADGFSASFDLTTLNGSNGFAINGINAGDRAGESIINIGDINGDGIDDLAIGAIGTDINGAAFTGQTHVIFGATTGFSAGFDLDSLDGSNGFTVSGFNASDLSGFSVSSAGDFNGDGLDDLLIGAIFADANGGADSGEAYIIFGNSSGFSADIDLSTLDGGNGFAIAGLNAGDNLGSSVSSAGDINGDGFDDLLIGARNADANGNVDAGESYIIFGYTNGPGALPQELPGKAIVYEDMYSASPKQVVSEALAESFEADDLQNLLGEMQQEKIAVFFEQRDTNFLKNYLDDVDLAFENVHDNDIFMAYIDAEIL
jgi:VCBS repeat-containing protein